MRKAIVAGLLTVLALAPSAPAAAALSLAAGEQMQFTVHKGDSVRLLVDGDDGLVVVRNRGAVVESFGAHCDASRPKLVLSRKGLVYRLQCDQRKK